MGIIKKSTNNKFWGDCGEKGTLLQLVRMEIGTASGKQYGGSLKKLKTKNRDAIWLSDHTPGHISEKTLIWKDTCTPIAHSTPYNSQDKEATKVFIDTRMGKE